MSGTNKTTVVTITGEPTSEEELNELHGQLGRTLKNIILGGEVVIDKQGNPVSLTPSPALLNVARQFLKDNNVQAKADKNPYLGELLDDLPFTDRPT